MAITASQLIAKVAVEGDTEAKAKLHGISDTVKQTGEGFKGMLSGALNFAAGMGIFNIASQAVGFFKDTIAGAFQESMDAEAELAQTNKVLQSTHDASGMAASAIVDLSSSLSHLTKFTDDEVQIGENLLLTFTNIGKNVFPDATKVMLDMSQAMGQDVKESAIQLGKALNDPLTGMTSTTHKSNSSKPIWSMANWRRRRRSFCKSCNANLAGLLWRQGRRRRADSKS